LLIELFACLGVNLFYLIFDTAVTYCVQVSASGVRKKTKYNHMLIKW